MEFHIRQGSKNDLRAIYDLVYDLAVYENESQALTATMEDYQRDFEEGCFEALVAEYEGQIIGMALYYMTYSTWKGKMMYLEDFVIKEKFRRKGAGQMVFDHLLKVAGQKQARLLKWQVLDWNEPALNFYHKNEAIIERNWWNGKVFIK